MVTAPQAKLANDANVAYRRAYAGFNRHAHTVAAITPMLDGGECFVAKPLRDGVEVNGALRIERLPRNRSDGEPNPREPRICVLFESRDFYRPDADGEHGEGRKLASSVVRIGYYRAVDSTWKTLLGIRYDYDFRGARGRHPIFHAQFDNGELHMRSAPLFPGLPKIDKLNDVLTGVRVPTANVIGATALLKLAADHLSLQSFLAVQTEIASLPFFKNWQCDLRSLDDPESPRQMLSCGWYGTKQ